MSICITGSAAYDTVFSYRGEFGPHFDSKHLNHINVCFPATSMVRYFGGCGANIAYAVSLLGDPVTLLCAFGENDAAPFETHLKNCGINLFTQSVPNEFTSQCILICDAAGSQIATFSANAADFTRTDTWPEDEAFDIGILSPETRFVMLRRLKQFTEHKTPFFFDPGQITPRFSSSELVSFFEAAQYIVMSDYEFEVVQRKTGLTESELLKHAKALFITRSENGATVFTKDGSLTVDAVPVHARDTIGAGDAFRAGLLHAVTHNLSWEKALKLGCAIASFKVEKQGAETYRPSKEAILSRIAMTYGDATGFAL